MHSIPPISLVQPVDKGPPTHPIPKLSIGQRRARMKRKIMTNQPIPTPTWTLAQAIQTPTQKETLSLPEPAAQSQENVQPQYNMPMPLTQHKPVDPIGITQPNRSQNTT